MGPRQRALDLSSISLDLVKADDAIAPELLSPQAPLTRLRPQGGRPHAEQDRGLNKSDVLPERREWRRGSICSVDHVAFLNTGWLVPSLATPRVPVRPDRAGQDRPTLR